MNDSLLRSQIRNRLTDTPGRDLTQVAEDLLAILGYRSERKLDGQSGSVDDFVDRFPADNRQTASEREFLENAESVRIVFQLTSTEIAAVREPTLFADDNFDEGNLQSFLFVAVELTGASTSSTRLVKCSAASR